MADPGDFVNVGAELPSTITDLDDEPTTTLLDRILEDATQEFKKKLIFAPGDDDPAPTIEKLEGGTPTSLVALQEQPRQHELKMFSAEGFDKMDLDNLSPGIEEAIRKDVNFKSDAFEEANHEIPEFEITDLDDVGSTKPILERIFDKAIEEFQKLIFAPGDDDPAPTIEKLEGGTPTSLVTLQEQPAQHELNMFSAEGFDKMDLHDLSPVMEEAICKEVTFKSDSFEEVNHEIPECEIPKKIPTTFLPPKYFENVSVGDVQPYQQQPSQTKESAPRSESYLTELANIPTTLNTNVVDTLLEKISTQGATGKFRKNRTGKSVCEKCGDLQKNHGEGGKCPCLPGRKTKRYNKGGRKKYRCGICRKLLKDHKKPCKKPKCSLRCFHNLINQHPRSYWMDKLSRDNKIASAVLLTRPKVTLCCAIDKTEIDASALCSVVTVDEKKHGAGQVAPAKRGKYNCKECHLPLKMHRQFYKMFSHSNEMVP